MNKRRNKIFDRFFIKSWWVILFFVFSLCVYAQTIKNKNKQIVEHKNKLLSLEKEKQSVIKENEDLKLMVNSLSDPAWIEMILIRDLGMVPEGKIKIHFTPPKE